MGAAGFCIRRNTIVVLMCLELMLNAANLALVAASYAVSSIQGQIIAFFTIVVAACESAIGLAIIIAVFRNIHSIKTSDSNRMAG